MLLIFIFIGPIFIAPLFTGCCSPLDRVVTDAIIVRLRGLNANSPALVGAVPWEARV